MSNREEQKWLNFISKDKIDKINSIIEYGHTEFGELWSQGLFDLMAKAQLQAVTDAQITPEQIDEIFVANMCAPQLLGQAHLGAIAACVLGVRCPAFSIEAAFGELIPKLKKQLPTQDLMQ